MTNKEEILKNTLERCRERNIIIPTYEEMRHPQKIPNGIKDELKNIGLWDLHSRNLFRITWKNEPVKFGGGFAEVNYVEIPHELSGVKARILMLIGKWFPTGSHKVGATFGPLVEKLVRGAFDPTRQKALWPSTGNYCRGGAYDSYLLACPSIAVLPEGMSRERFEWLEKVGSEIYATPGVESNVKEVYDKSDELKRERGDEIVILNQFDEIGNAIWHYAVTGQAIEEVYEKECKANQNLRALFLTQGSAGTLGCADYLRERYPRIKVCAGEALQCPTLLFNGYGGHRIEGIGDKHVPWIFNVKNMDLVADIDDEYCVRVMRLFNESAGRNYLKRKAIDPELVDGLDLLGISSIANLIGSIKLAKYYEMNENDIIFTIATDSMELYGSRLREVREERGEYRELDAAADFDTCLLNVGIDWTLELSYWDKRRMHNLKYFTWIEQRGKDLEELDRQWYDDNYWKEKFQSYKKWDSHIREFNEKTGLLKKYT
ncbi:pyridoxal-5-phosphate-dependent protein subunit beta [candidate division WOR-3 bacterium JGI_Cruoil_03_44_89]|uniref:Pyridoxal-5-phosphate-dependent protein subunit beta n=1 Tax=candidate division WOR-3 bacterium JGI_Cruoil_03_44_89 TaxID=1973748 RepID=A0A235BN76_UNCW3|nr:MAG: pyridoxal-5-phosphate-dependent protein subunit beta [candidate division WOR-3 bacterium JGI_Cruoil_03_44_89]